MQVVNMLQAKFTLSTLVEEIQRGKHAEIVIARNGRPAAKLVPIDSASADKRIGVAKGKFKVPEIIDTHNYGIARMFINKTSS